ncbi:transposase [Planosporangium flavigriseum]|uniref:RNA-guided endonuclease InsQ/TnpB family protein n=1 Tax=Planosporangium flavigriseum TaxID=373681 RepID=UPI00143957D3|nr:RNA-guided endonuclease TnpB family protein [Planosporangium flavigriseum]NJC64182.1 transposase [Planosporangium flavigriseum]
MIASREKAPKHGPGRLVVDGTDHVLHRKAQFALHPGAAAEARLLALLAALCECYNAALAERRDAYRATGRTVSLFEQYNQIKDLRGVRDDVLAWGIQPVRSALKRLDEAMAAFFRRVRAGQVPGFPRFRSRSRFDTACWDEPTSWKLGKDAETGRWRLAVQGVGTVALSKKASRQLDRLVKRGGDPATLTITRRRAGTGWVWRATVGFKNVTTQPLPGTGRVIGVDRGVAVTAATSDGQLLRYPAQAQAARDTAVLLGQSLAGKKRGSRAWRKTVRTIARERCKAAAIVDNWARETAKTIVAAADVLVVEDLELKNMTRSAKGTVDKPGRNVRAKAGLNRSLSGAALGKLATRVAVKAEEAGRTLWRVNPAYTSQDCPACGHRRKGNRDRTVFRCLNCGHTTHADVNAAVNIAAAGQQAHTVWQAAGAPPLARPKPRLRRRTADQPLPAAA